MTPTISRKWDLRRSISQPHEAGWIVVFISHRWWGGNHPDDKERKLKHGIICRGIEALIRRDKLDASRVGVWIDYACIEQDNGEEMQNGIDSLIAYVQYMCPRFHVERKREREIIILNSI